MQVTFRIPEGPIHSMILEPYFSIEQIIQKINEIKIVSNNNFHLTFKGEILTSFQVLRNIGISEKDEILIQYNTIHDPLSLESLINPPNSHSKENNKDPTNFSDLVRNLLELGFDEKQCEDALRISNYQPDSAASLLINGTLNEPKRSVYIVDPNEFDDYSDQNYSDESDDFQNNSNSDSKPVKKTNIKSNNQFRTLLNNFKPEERQAFNRIQKMFDMDESVIIQVFIACDKNESNTTECLKSMK